MMESDVQEWTIPMHMRWWAKNVLTVTKLLWGDGLRHQRGFYFNLTFLMFAVYCFIAIFSTVLSKPKKDLISRLASCSKQVHAGLSGCTYNTSIQIASFVTTKYIVMHRAERGFQSPNTQQSQITQRHGKSYVQIKTEPAMTIGYSKDCKWN